MAWLRAPTSKGELSVCLGVESEAFQGGGHFSVTLEGREILPALRTPNLFRSAPLVGGCAGTAARGDEVKILDWTPTAEIPRLVLDLTAAYPPEAGLLFWTRSLECWKAGRGPEGSMTPAKMVLTDVFRTREPRQKITHVIWSLEGFKEPDERVEGTGFRLNLGGLKCEISPAPYALSCSAFTPTELLLQDFAGETFHKIEAVYRTDEQGELKLETRFYA